MRQHDTLFVMYLITTFLGIFLGAYAIQILATNHPLLAIIAYIVYLAAVFIGTFRLGQIIYDEGV